MNLCKRRVAGKRCGWDAPYRWETHRSAHWFCYTHYLEALKAEEARTARARKERQP